MTVLVVGGAGYIGSHMARALADPDYPENLIVQEFLEGPSYSLEIIGRPGAYRTYAVTQIHMDAVYDCCQVTTPCILPPGQDAAFFRLPMSSWMCLPARLLSTASRSS